MSQAGGLLEQARAAITAGRYDEAIEQLDSLKSEGVPEAFPHLAEAFALRGKYLTVLSVYLEWAESELARGELDKAETALSYALSLRPDSLEAHRVRVEVARARGQESELIDRLKELAILSLEKGEGEDSVVSLQQARELRPEDIDLSLQLAEVYVSVGQINSAVNEYRRCANQFRDRGEIKLSLKPLKRLKMLRSDDIPLMLELGTACLALGRADEAEEQFRAVLRLDLENQEALLCLGKACLKKGLFRNGMLALNKVVQLDPERAEAYECLGDIQRATGENSEATTSYQKAIQLFLERGEKEKGNEVLRKLERWEAGEESLVEEVPTAECISSAPEVPEERPLEPLPEPAKAETRLQEFKRPALIKKTDLVGGGKSSKPRLLPRGLRERSQQSNRFGLAPKNPDGSKPLLPMERYREGPVEIEVVEQAGEADGFVRVEEELPKVHLVEPLEEDLPFEAPVQPDEGVEELLPSYEELFEKTEEVAEESIQVPVEDSKEEEIDDGFPTSIFELELEPAQEDQEISNEIHGPVAVEDEEDSFPTGIFELELELDEPAQEEPEEAALENAEEAENCELEPPQEEEEELSLEIDPDILFPTDEPSIFDQIELSDPEWDLDEPMGALFPVEEIPMEPSEQTVETEEIEVEEDSLEEPASEESEEPDFPWEQNDFDDLLPEYAEPLSIDIPMPPAEPEPEQGPAPDDTLGLILEATLPTEYEDGFVVEDPPPEFFEQEQCSEVEAVEEEMPEEIDCKQDDSAFEVEEEPVVEDPLASLDAGAAVEHLKGHLTQYPTDEEQLLLLGDLSLRYGLLKDALRRYQALERIRPGCLEATRRVVKAALWMEDYQTVKQGLWKASRLHFDRGQLTECQDSLGSLLSLEPEHREAKQLMVEVFLASGQEKLAAWHLSQMADRWMSEKQFEHAEAALSRLIEVAPDNHGRERLAKLYDFQGKEAQALSLYRQLREEYQAQELWPKAIELAELLVASRGCTVDDNQALLALYDRCQMTEKAVAEKRRLAERLRADGEFSRAIELLQSVLNERPEKFEARGLLVELLLESDKLLEAEQQSEILAERFLNDKSYTEGVGLFELWVKAAPENSRARERLAQFYQLSGDLEGAKLEWLLVTESLEMQGDYERAALSLERALELAPHEREWRLRLARLRGERLDQWKESLGELRTLFSEHPTWDQATNLYLNHLLKRRAFEELGEALRKLAQLPAGTPFQEFVLQAVEREVEENPTDLELQFGWGELCYAMNHLDRAIEQFQRLRRLDEYKLRAYRLLGCCFARKEGLNMRELALSQFRKGLFLPDQDPAELVKLRLEMAQVLEQMGRAEEALEQYRECLAVEPGNTVVLAQMDRLKE